MLPLFLFREVWGEEERRNKVFAALHLHQHMKSSQASNKTAGTISKSTFLTDTEESKSTLDKELQFSLLFYSSFNNHSG